MPATSSRSAWEDPDQYRYLADLDRAGLAWEFVRRNPVYRAMVIRLGKVSGGTASQVILSDGWPSAAPWGLSFRRTSRRPRRNGAVVLERSA